MTWFLDSSLTAAGGGQRFIHIVVVIRHHPAAQQFVFLQFLQHLFFLIPPSLTPHL